MRLRALLFFFLASVAVSFGMGDWRIIVPKPPAPTNAPPVVTNLPPPVVTNKPPRAMSEIHATSFLLHNVSAKCSFRLMDPKNSPDDKRAIIQYLRDQDYTVAYVAATIWGDPSGGRSKFIYRHEAREGWRYWFAQCREAGLRVIVWLRSDDSPEQDAWSETKWKEFIALVQADLGDLVSEYVIGLEVNEYWIRQFGDVELAAINRAVSTGRLVKYLQEISGKPVGVHTGSIKHWEYAQSADAFYLQYGFGQSVSDIVAKTREARRLLPGKRIYATEYHKSGETDEAKRLGEAAVIEGGADGFGNGGTARAIEVLRQRAGQAPVLEPPPASPTNAAGALSPSNVHWLTSRGPNYGKAETVLALSDVRISGSRCYFTPSPKIPWPARGKKGVNAIGILIRNIGGRFVGGKCEWVVGKRGWFDCRTNVQGGYNGHTLPQSGETVWVGIGNPDDGSEVSQLVATRWP